MSALDSVFTPFYVDVFLRLSLLPPTGLRGPAVASGSLTSAAPTVVSTPTIVSNSSSGAVAVTLAADDPPASPAHRWILLSFLCGQLAYVVVCGLGDLGVGWVASARVRMASKRRLSRLSVVGPLWALCVVLLWLPWGFPPLPVGLRVTVGLALCNALSTRTVEAARAAIADSGMRQADRERCVARVFAMTALGRLIIGPASLLYETGECLRGFRWFAVVSAALAAAGLATSGRAAQAGSGGSHTGEVSLGSPMRGGALGRGADSGVQQFWTVVCQSMSRPSMKAVTVLWALQAYSYTMSTHLFGLFLALVCSATISPSVRACLVLLAFAAPHAVVGVTPLLSMGRKRVVAAALASRCALGVAITLLGVSVLVQARPAVPIHSTASFLFALLLVANRLLTEVTGHLQARALADVTDEDTIIFGRARSATAVLSSLMSIVSRPFECLALMVVGAYVLAYATAPQEVTPVGIVPAAVAARAVLLLGLSVVFTAGVALSVWQRCYTLDGKHLQFIQMAMRKRMEDEEVEQV